MPPRKRSNSRKSNPKPQTFSSRAANWLVSTLATAAPASAATTAVVSLCGELEERNAAAPLNAVSHILWGDSAARQDDLSLKHTASGIALNTVAITSWAGVYEAVFGGRARRGSNRAAILGGIATSALAYVTDYYVVPRRFTPGFEKRLSPLSMFAVYASLALSLPLASMLGRKPPAAAVARPTPRRKAAKPPARSAASSPKR
jgi:hypothetical protein